jgi:protease-4
MFKPHIASLFILIGLSSGCATLKLKLFVDKSHPLHEYTISGTATPKILVVDITGIISSHDDVSILGEKPGVLENVVAQLRLAENDSEIKALLLKIDSPGGMTTTSDILYNEIMKYKRRTGNPIVVSMMDVAASGGYGGSAGRPDHRPSHHRDRLRGRYFHAPGFFRSNGENRSFGRCHQIRKKQRYGVTF